MVVVVLSSDESNISIKVSTYNVRMVWVRIDLGGDCGFDVGNEMGVF